ncbi:MAG: AAA family ATPase [Alphaproteobacteria bacterium]|nr:AAA family ATPase [Alphaproteobacteria bacterium]
MSDEYAQNERQATKLSNITIKGFKSLENIENFSLQNMNILVGANGTGKSNFLNFFGMLSWMIRGKNLQVYIAKKGGGDDLLFNGAKHTRSIECIMTFKGKTGQTEYSFHLQHTENNQLVFSREEYRFTGNHERNNNLSTPNWTPLGIGHMEAKIHDITDDKTAHITRKILQNCTIYQFHDTSETSPLKFSSDMADKVFLKGDGQNLASILYDLQQNQNKYYQEIVNTIQLVLPVFADFELQPYHEKIALRWRAKNMNDKTFGAHLTSDGTLRFFALVTLLCLPKDRISDVVLLDEPELGLHPYAISLLADLIKRLAKSKQVIVATQSTLLLNEFDVENIIITNMAENGATTFSRLKKNKFQKWLDEYNLGDLWQKNVFGGNPK